MTDERTCEAAGPADRSPARGAAREQAILAATMELVAELGYERVTVDAIAARARASKATIYRRWAGKAEIVAEGLRRHAESDLRVAVDSGSLRGDLLMAVQDMSRGIDGDHGPSLVGLLDALRGDPALRDLVRSHMQARSRAVSRVVVERERLRGGVRAPSPDDVVFVLDVAVAQLSVGALLTGVVPRADDRRELVDDVLLPLLAHRCPGGAGG